MKQVALYLQPAFRKFQGDKLFDDRTNPLSGDNILAPYKALREYFEPRGIPVHTGDMLQEATPNTTNLYFSLGMTEGHERLEGREDVIKSGFFAMECPIVEPKLYLALPEMAGEFKRMLSWSRSESLMPFTKTRVETQRFCWPQSYDTVHAGLWENTDRGFLVLMNANKLPRLYWQELVTKRLEAVTYFEQFGEIDLYGPQWDRMPHRVGHTWVPYTFKRIHRLLWEQKQKVLPNPDYAAARRAWKGTAASKSQTLSKYDFAICFENMILEGWITEKIFDCFFAGTVPVYWGAPDILEWVPQECFIDMQQFSGFAELRDFLKSRTPAQIQGYRDAAKAFLESPRYEPWKKSAFVDLFRRVIEEDTGISV